MTYTVVVLIMDPNLIFIWYFGTEIYLITGSEHFRVWLNPEPAKREWVSELGPGGVPGVGDDVPLLLTQCRAGHQAGGGGASLQPIACLEYPDPDPDPDPDPYFWWSKIEKMENTNFTFFLQHLLFMCSQPSMKDFIAPQKASIPP